MFLEYRRSIVGFASRIFRLERRIELVLLWRRELRENVMVRVR